MNNPLILDEALKYIREGVHIALVVGVKPLSNEWNTNLLTEDKCRQAFEQHNITGFGLVVTDDVVILDFDNYDLWLDFSMTNNKLIADLPIESTGKGIHLAFKSATPGRCARQVLAKDAEGKTLIEIPSQVVSAPSEHYNKNDQHDRDYEVIAGSFHNLPVLSDAMVDKILTACRSYDCGPESVCVANSAMAAGVYNRKVVRDFNERSPVHSLLKKYGYSQSPDRQDRWRSPKCTDPQGEYDVQVFGDYLIYSQDALDPLHECAAGSVHSKGQSAFDLLRIYECGKNYRAAFAKAEEMLVAKYNLSYAPVVTGDNRTTTKIHEEFFEYLGLRFRKNVIGDQVECDWVTPGQFVPIVDDMFSVIYTRAADIGLLSKDLLESNMKAIAYRCQVNPIHEKLEGTIWDRIPRVDALIGHLTVPDEIEKAIIKKWMVGIIHKLYYDLSHEYPMLVWDGEQGLGKSYFWEWLTKPLGTFYRGQINPGDKDQLFRLFDTVLWEAEELASTTKKADIDELKSFITTTVIRARRPYAHFDVTGVSITSLVGTINDVGGFLRDSTGNRRFWPVYVTQIDWAYTVMPVMQVWAELYDLYKTDFDIRLNAEEKAYINDSRKKYAAELPFEDILAIIVKNLGNAEKVKAAHLIQKMQEADDHLKYESSTSIGRGIVTTMNSLGYRKVRRNDGFWYDKKV